MTNKRHVLATPLDDEFNWQGRRQDYIFLPARAKDSFNVDADISYLAALVDIRGREL